MSWEPGPPYPDLQIHRARAAQAAELSSIAIAAKRHWGYPEAWLAMWADDLTVSADYIEGEAVYAATFNARTVGWCAIRDEAGRSWLDACWVLPDAMGRGIGRQLVRRAMAVAAERRSTVLGVVSDPNAVDFYRKLGFRLVGEQPSVPTGRRLPVLEVALASGDA